MMNNFKIVHKISMLTLAQIVVVISLGWITLSQMKNIGKEIVDIAEIDVPLTNILTQVAEHQLQQVISFERSAFEASLVLFGKSKQEAVLSEIEKSKVLSASIEKELHEANGLVESAINSAQTQFTVDKFSDFSQVLKTIEEHYVTLHRETVAIQEKIAKGKVLESVDEIHLLEKHQTEFDHELLNALHQIQEFTATSAKHAEEYELNAIYMISVGLVISVIVSILLGVVIGRMITKPINELKDQLEEVSNGNGDLTVRLNKTGKDEIASVSRSFDRFVEKLAVTMLQIGSSSVALQELSKISVDLMNQNEKNIQEQGHETEMVTHAVTEMSIATDEISQSTAKATNLAEKVKNSVKEGKNSAATSQKIISEMAIEVSKTSNDLEALAEETENIGTVLEAIQGIAEQTNLLALNAAIEAARAGETGRGFAVVADEVRTLAQRTQEATVSIQALIEKLQLGAKEAVSSMLAGNQKTEECLKYSNETVSIFNEAFEAVNSISDLNIQIAAAVEEQSQVAKDIHKSVDNIQEISINTTKGTQKCSEANGSMATSIDELNQSIQQFKV
ncbi:MAG: methyl-accepting chemotaxis protein [Marinomonas sp.]